jgi:hypothetical protein
MTASGKDLRNAELDPYNVRVPQELGREYLVSLKVIHHLHCLVSLQLSIANNQLIEVLENFL